MDAHTLLNLLRQPVTQLVLLGLSGVVWAGVYWQTSVAMTAFSPDRLVGESPSGETSAKVTGLPVRNQERQFYEVIASRNLFSPDRQPHIENTPIPKGTVGPPTPTPKVEELKDFKFELSGVLKFGNRFKKAFISGKADGSEISKGFSVGEDVGGYTVRKIKTDEVYLARNEEPSIKLQFERFGQGGSFESSYQQILQQFQVNEGEKVFERTGQDGSTEQFQRATISGNEVEIPLVYKPDVLDEKIRSGEVSLTISGTKFDSLPDVLKLSGSGGAGSVSGVGTAGGAGGGSIKVSGMEVSRPASGSESSGEEGFVVVSGRKVPTSQTATRPGLTISGVEKK